MLPPGVFAEGSKGPGALPQRVNPGLVALDTFGTFCYHVACSQVVSAGVSVLHFCHPSYVYTISAWHAATRERAQHHHMEGGSRVGDLSHFQAPFLPCGLLPGGVSASYSKYGAPNNIYFTVYIYII